MRNHPSFTMTFSENLPSYFHVNELLTNGHLSFKTTFSKKLPFKTTLNHPFLLPHKKMNYWPMTTPHQKKQTTSFFHSNCFRNLLVLFPCKQPLTDHQPSFILRLLLFDLLGGLKKGFHCSTCCVPFCKCDVMKVVTVFVTCNFSLVSLCQAVGMSMMWGPGEASTAVSTCYWRMAFLMLSFSPSSSGEMWWFCF